MRNDAKIIPDGNRLRCGGGWFTRQWVVLSILLCSVLSLRIAGAATGQVVAWGDNSYSQTNVPPGLSNVVAISAGDFFSLALQADGRLMGWGSDNTGETDIPTGLSNLVAISAGGYHSLALDANGRIIAWGYNNYGQANVPPGLSNVLAIAAGDYHSLALKSDGKVVGWGNNSFGVSTVPAGLSNVVAISAGAGHNLALRSDGTVVAWGFNGNHETQVPLGLNNVIAISAGDNHNLALRSDGLISGWGNNSLGQRNIPASVANPAAISAGGQFGMALMGNGTVARWGDTRNGLGFLPPGLTNVIAISGGGGHALVLTGLQPPVVVQSPSRQTVAGNQSTFFRVAAVGTFPMTYQWKLDGVAVPGATNAVLMVTDAQLSQAGAYSVILSNAVGSVTSSPAVLTVVPFVRVEPTNQSAYAGTTVSFSTVFGGLNPATFQWRFDGTDLPGATNSDLVLTNLQVGQSGRYSILVSNSFGSLASSEAGLAVIPLSITEQPQSAYMWPHATATLSVTVAGEGNIQYQWQFNGTSIPGATNNPLVLTNLGFPDTGNYSVLVTNEYGGATSSVARLVVTSMFAWGNNNNGQTNIPAELTNVVSVANGYAWTLALRDDRSLLAWGDNSYGQTNIPLGLTDVIGIAAGSYHGLAVRTDGRVVAWGYNGHGETNVPTFLSNVVAVAAGSTHSLALRADGRVFGWGFNSDGQISVPNICTNIVAISAGDSHSLALRGDGQVFAWGLNNHFQGYVPSWITNIVSIAAGGFHNLAVHADGHIDAWGSLFNVNNEYTWQAYVFDSSSSFAAVGAGAYFSLALHDNRTVLAWGDNSDGQVSFPPALTNVFAISGGALHATALAGDRAPFVFTQPADRRVDGAGAAYFTVSAAGTLPLGYQWRLNGSDLPGATNAILGLENAQVIQAGAYSVVVSNVFGAATNRIARLEVDPFVAIQPTSQTVMIQTTVTFRATSGGLTPPAYQWRFGGTNIEAATNSDLLLTNVQLSQSGLYSVIASNPFGSATSPPVTLTVVPLFIASQPLSQGVSRGGSATFSVAASGAGPFTYQWQFGGTNIPNATNSVLVLTDLQLDQTGAYTVIVGNPFGSVTSAVAALAVSQVVAWGSNASGQTNVPQTLTNVVAIAGGPDNSLALRSNGRVTAWGGTYFVPAFTNLVAVAAGETHSVGLLANGRVVGWGYFLLTNSPAGLSNVVAIAAGNNYSAALVSNGRVVQWGQRGGLFTNLPPGLSDVVAIAAGKSHILALTAEGRVIAAGNNFFGQTNVPGNLSNVVLISAGDAHSLALTAEGDVVAWGSNASGQTNVPLGLSNVVSVAAGGAHSLALTADGRVIGWGSNGFGQVTIPDAASNVAAIAAGRFHSLALLAPIDPIAPNFELRLFPELQPGNVLAAWFPTVAGRFYTVEYTGTLPATNWTPAATFRGYGYGVRRTFTYSATNPAQRFFRVRQHEAR